jgi:2-iminobutanoate/2-iminopropanoate deaminase
MTVGDFHVHWRAEDPCDTRGEEMMAKAILKSILASFLLLPTLARGAEKKSLGTELVPAGTPYSPGVLVGDTLYISGLQGTDQRTHALPKDFRQEVKNCLDNVGLVLKEGDMDYSNVVSVQIYLVDMSQFPKVNAIYETYFKSPLPSRTTVQVAKLSLGAHIEIAAVAHK